eukprot:CAMPEP_0174971066 /NCGR_PEP_ID=MMETSP0004_2-20121128/9770_1 /TAXON_ID=420556 /ORGANISM="Ochromonas sp., Strain CCMP1393" /LENGTH=225 /DNA_ID=CAMNT_0016220943 /DNA_START=47 /DNA_END=724 /DNA_ORIENTATION=+
MMLLIVLFLLLMLTPSCAFHGVGSLATKQQLRVGCIRVAVDKRNSIDPSPIAIEVTTKKITSEDQRIVAYDALYEEETEDRVSIALDSPVAKILDIVTNPVALVVFLYFSILTGSKITNFWNKVLTAIGWREKSDEPVAVVEKMEELPYQVFECEVCEMNMRPAKGRAEKIFSRERFRCSRCGARASAYFNIDDMNDPRAVARKERLEREAEEEDDYDYDDESDE